MRLSVQCYTLRSLFERDVLKTLEAIRGIGFNYIELAGTYGMPFRELKTRLDTLGLQVSGSHVGLDALEGDLEQVIEDNYTIDNRYIILPWVEHPLDPMNGGETGQVVRCSAADAWRDLGKRLDEIGARIREAGLWFAYHNHAFEMELVDGRPGLDLLFAASDPAHVQAQFDVAWVKHGGQDPAAYIRRYGARCPLVHLKDITDDGKDCIAGEGIVDWDDVLGACAAADVEFGVIEMDVPPGDPIMDVRRCARYYQDRELAF